MILELILGLLGFLFLWDYLAKKHRNDVIERSRISAPRALPIIGNILQFSGVTQETYIDFMNATVQKYGKLHRLWFFHELHITVVEPKYVEAILSSQKLQNKSNLYAFLASWLGNGLLLSTGKKWHTRRKIITPTFHFKILEHFVEIFDQQSDVMIKKLQERADGKTAINIFPVICLMALDIIAETAMGVKVHAQQNPDISYVKALTRTASIMGDRFVKPIQQIDWLFALLYPKKHAELKTGIQTMHKFTDEVIKERREALQKSISDGVYKSTDGEEADDVGRKKRMALLDVLLQSTVAGSPLSNEDIREEVDTFMFEGHDTTTSGISFCLYLISRHPEEQQKLIEEIHTVLGEDKTRPVSYQDLQELKYLECVIKESMRMFPPIPIIARQTTEDIVLDDIIIPAYANVNLQFFTTFRDPEYFPDPDTFKPERFSAETDVKINPFAYTPFSAGPRNCIGQRFALFEMKSTVSKMLRHFELLPLGPAVRPTTDLVLRSANGVHIGLKPRK